MTTDPRTVPDPEGHVRYGGDCICGAVYTYNGIAEPGQFDHHCPDHGDPEYVKALELLESKQAHLPSSRAWTLDDVQACATCEGGGCRDCID